MASKRVSQGNSARRSTARAGNSGAPVTPSRKRYKRNFLKQVIARIDFTSHIPTLDEGPPQSVVQAIKKQFPIAEPRKQVLQQVMFSTSAGVQQSRQETYQWMYHSRKRDKLINVTGEFMYVEYKSYESFDILRNDFLIATNALFDAVDGLQVKRLGLRYIDNLDFPKEKNPTEWEQYLHPDVLSAFNLADDPATVARAFHVLDLNYGDMNMRFQYGMANPDFPAVVRRKLFTLDHDVYCARLLGREEIPQYLDRFHERINASFERVITDGLRKKMGLAHDQRRATVLA